MQGCTTILNTFGQDFTYVLHIHAMVREARNMEDFVTWVDTSKIKRKVLQYNDRLDDYDLLSWRVQRWSDCQLQLQTCLLESLNLDLYSSSRSASQETLPLSPSKMNRCKQTRCCDLQRVLAIVISWHCIILWCCKIWYAACLALIGWLIWQASVALVAVCKSTLLSRVLWPSCQEDMVTVHFQQALAALLSACQLFILPCL